MAVSETVPTAAKRSVSPLLLVGGVLLVLLVLGLIFLFVVGPARGGT